MIFAQFLIEATAVCLSGALAGVGLGLIGAVLAVQCGVLAGRRLDRLRILLQRWRARGRGSGAFGGARSSGGRSRAPMTSAATRTCSRLRHAAMELPLASWSAATFGRPPCSRRSCWAIVMMPKTSSNRHSRWCTNAQPASRRIVSSVRGCSRLCAGWLPIIVRATCGGRDCSACGAKVRWPNRKRFRPKAYRWRASMPRPHTRRWLSSHPCSAPASSWSRCGTWHPSKLQPCTTSQNQPSDNTCSGRDVHFGARSKESAASTSRTDPLTMTSAYA